MGLGRLAPGRSARPNSDVWRLATTLALGGGFIAAQANVALCEPSTTSAPLPTVLTPPVNTPDIAARRLELRGVEDTIGVTQEMTRKLEGEIASHAVIREQLNRTLLEATQKLRDTESRAAEIEERLATLADNEQRIVKSLEGRRTLIVEILTVLQRMGRRPPPALLARPQDILEAVRASLALGAVLPEIRGEAVQLQNDLAELVRLRDDTHKEQARLAEQKINLQSQRDKLAPMIAARQQAQAAAQSALQAEAERVRTLAQQATSLKDLIARMEVESESARQAADAARKAEEERLSREAKLSEEQRKKTLAAPFKDAARLAPAVAFPELKGRLNLPVSGAILRAFGAPDGFGGKEKGYSIGARDNGVVVAPCDGWVAFSGAYRSYGQLLIINAGGGYYVVLAGMSRTSVNVGQFVLAGEPVASMGDGAAKTAATIAIGAKQPILYVEFRKDGTSIDSSPWWAKSDSRKVGG